jgi:hypothetical protein
MSPATMYSFARATIALKSSGAVFDVGGTVSGPAGAPAASLSSGRSSASTIAERRSDARLNAAAAVTLASGRTGVTTVMESCTASNTITMVGRSMMASGVPTTSGLGGGSSSISRTMS